MSAAERWGCSVSSEPREAAAIREALNCVWAGREGTSSYVVGEPASPKAMTLRLSVEQYEDLRVLARISGRPVAEEVREAVTAYIASRKADPAFAVKAREIADGWAAFAEGCVA